MVKRPTRGQEPDPEPDTEPAGEPQTAQPELPPPPPRQHPAPPAPPVRATVTPTDATSDANVTAIIQQQMTLLTTQLVEAIYLEGEMMLTPPPPATQPTPPPGSDLQSITDCLFGANRALGGYLAQLNTLLVLWPAIVPAATGTSAVNGQSSLGNGGSP